MSGSDERLADADGANHFVKPVVQARVAALIYIAHASRANLRKDLMGPSLVPAFREMFAGRISETATGEE